MKFLLPLLILPFTSISQSYNDDQARLLLNKVQFFQTDIAPSYVDLDLHRCDSLGIKTVTINQGKNKEKTRKRLKKLEGDKLIETITEANNYQYSYVDDSLLGTILVTGKNPALTRYQYDDGRVVQKEYYKDEKLKSRIVAQYNPEELISFSLLQTGPKLKHSYAMYYDYSDANLRSQKFFKNDRLLKKWDYTCEPEGKLVNERKLALLCKYVEESNDGSYINYIRKIENGKPLLYSYSFTNDSINYASICTREDGLIVWKSEHNLLERTIVNYEKNGNIKSTIKLKYNKNNQIVEQIAIYGKKQKHQSKLINSYNEDGTLATSHSYYKEKMSYYRSYSYAKE